MWRVLVGTVLPVAAMAFASTQTVRAAQAPADGLYLAADGAPATELRTEDGETVFLGARQDLQLQDKWLKFRGIEERQLQPLYSGNWEATFNLQLTAAYDERNKPHILVVAGTVYRQSGAGAFTTPTSSGSSLHFGIWDEKHAAEVARYFDIPIQYPTHPGHRLRVWFTPDKPFFSRGEPVTVTLHIENLGDEPVRFLRRGRGPGETPESRDNQFVFAAYQNGQSIPDIGRSSNADVLSGSVELNPGASFEDSANLDNWFEFNGAGNYQVHGSYFLSFLKPESRLFDSIWAEYVSSDFSVRIR
jgi:hypothetical protein